MTLYGECAPDIPQTWDRYAYVGGTPLELVDPMGTCPAVSKNGSGKAKNGEAAGDFGPYVPEDATAAGEQATADGDCTPLDGVDLPPGLFSELGGVGGGWGGGGSAGISPLLSSGGQSYEIEPSPYGGYCYKGQVDQWICAAPSYGGELGLPDPNLVEAQIGALDAALDASSTAATQSAQATSGPSLTTPAQPRFSFQPKTSLQCSVYQDGTGSGSALYQLCSKVFPNGPWLNRMRGCLESLYSPHSGYLPIPLVVFDPTPLLVNIPGAGAHVSCAVAAGRG